MDMVGGISGFQTSEAKIFKLKSEEPDKIDRNIPPEAGEEKTNIKISGDKYSVLSKLNVANSKVTMEEADKAMAMIMKSVKEKPEKMLQAQSKVDRDNVIKVLS